MQHPVCLCSGRLVATGLDRLDQTCPALGLFRRGHLGGRHPDGRRLGIRGPELWRLLGVGSRGEFIPRALDGLGGCSPPFVDQPQPHKTHRAVLHSVPECPGFLAGALLHLPDEEWRLGGHLCAQLCRQRHPPPASCLFAHLRCRGAPDAPRRHGVTQNLRGAGFGQFGRGGLGPSCPRAVGLPGGDGGCCRACLPQGVPLKRCGGCPLVP